MAAKIEGAGGTTASFSNTPQAVNDVFALNEDTLDIFSAGAGHTSVFKLDVMGNDLGGNAKSLYSIDDGVSAPVSTTSKSAPAGPVDLTQADLLSSGVSDWEDAGQGILIRIDNGKIDVDITGYLAAHGWSSINAIPAGTVISESFTYAIKLGNGTLSWATASFTIAGTNDAAVITGATSGHAYEAGGTNNGTGGANASGDLNSTDVDGTNDAWTAVTTATASDNGYGKFTVGSDGQWTYVVEQGNATVQALKATESLTDTFTVYTQDGTAQQVTVTIHGANDVPVLTGTQASLGGGTEDQTYSISSADLLAGFTDVEGDTLSVSGLTADNGTLQNNGDGTWTFTPDANFNGSVSLSYNVIDGQGGSVAATQTFGIAAVNDVPVANADSLAATEDTAATYSAAQLTGNDTDIEGSPLTIASVTSGSGGTAVLNGDGTVTFTPNANYNGPADFTYTVSDGTDESAPATASISVAAVNDAASIGGALSGSITEDAIPNTVSGTATATDVDNPNNTFQVESGNATHGTFSVAANGTWTYALNNADSTVDALNNGNTLPDSFTIHSADGTAQTVSITINGHTDAPPDTQGPTGTNFILNAAAISQAEKGTQLDANTIIGTFVQTGDPNSTVFHYALGGADAGLFTLDTSTGVLSSGVANVAVRATPYALTITAYDQANNAGPVIPVNVYVLGSGADGQTGTSGIDIMFGMNGNDSLNGSGGSDALMGGQNVDELTGGLGADQLVGGSNKDTFVYTSLNDSSAASGIDTIYNFTHGGSSADKIDVSAIDAKPLVGGDQAFTFNGTTATANGIWYTESGGNTTVHFDTNGSAASDEMTIVIVGTGLGLDAGDFSL
jgi:VCBS repeat-containing protein